MCARLGLLTVVSLFLLAMACGTKPPGPGPISPPAATAATTDSQCAKARVERQRVPGLLAQGKLDRTLRVIARANALCPDEAPASWGDEVATLAEIGRYEDARTLVATITRSERPDPATKARAERALALVEKRDVKLEASDEAKKPMRDRYNEALSLEQRGQDANMDHDLLIRAKEAYLAAWEAWRPNGKALAAAGLCARDAAKTDAERAEAQRLFDRAIEDLKRDTGAHDVNLEAPNGFTHVRSMAWSRKLLAVADGQDVVVFERATKRPKYRLVGHTGAVNAVAFSPDGQMLASGSDDTTIRVWTLVGSTPAIVLRGHSGAVQAVAFSPDGQLVASGSDDTTARVWALSETASSLVLREHGNTVTAVAFRPHGAADTQTLATGSKDTRVRLWDLPRASWPRPDRQDASPTGLRIASAFSADHGAGGAEAGSGLRVLAGHTDEVTSLDFSPDGKTLATASLDGSVLLWAVEPGTKTHVLRDHGGPVHTVSFSPDGLTLASGSSDGAIRLWPARSGLAPVLLPGPHPHGVGLVAFSPDGQALASIGSPGHDDAVQVWEVRAKGKPQPLHAFKEHTSEVSSVVVTPDGDTLAFAAKDGAIRVWSGSGAPRWLAGASPIDALAITRDGRTLASGAEDGVVRVWSVATEGTLPAPRELRKHTRPVHSIAFSPDGQRLASGSLDTTALVWLVRDGTVERTLTESLGVESVAFTPDGARLVTGYWSGVITMWTLADGTRHALGGNLGWVHALAFAPDGRTLASGSGDESVGLWSIEHGESRVLRGHKDAVASVAYSSAGSLASGSLDGTVRLWTPDTSDASQVLEGHTRSVASVAFARDGAVLVSGSADGSVLLWSTATRSVLLTLRATEPASGSYAFTPDGYVAPLEPEARAHVICRVGNLTYPVDLCEERFTVPGLFARVMAGDTSYRDP